jgi:hypothetical protein
MEIGQKPLEIDQVASATAPHARVLESNWEVTAHVYLVLSLNLHKKNTLKNSNFWVVMVL